MARSSHRLSDEVNTNYQKLSKNRLMKYPTMNTGPATINAPINEPTTKKYMFE